ncbi:hypothetical protein ABZ307_38330 [Streptomyces griseorubiginosus]|uniref:hypothetical protein n=1 Tax=Streptomyces griseorubiginosus TaxID=67304 RepID=UPI0033AF30F3
MGGWQRLCWWGLAALGAVSAVVLVIWVAVADLEKSSQIAGVMGALLAAAALLVALWQLRTQATAPAPGESVHAEAGSNAARGSIRSTQSRDTSSNANGTVSRTTGITARGGSNAAGGDIDGSTAHHGP